ncbi:hypothetical protein [Aureispira anguillae]|uniref:Uncharacterized protein n=1 Tax=Aureispira anguillae TaxID=2864201 RepID=A0A916DR37_9BACT|nr:hypothetical protein [Aureispira anguillae]BDS11574.1 hypothetical protein AsAng_0022880 [Aureispira anguillae]
MKNTSINVLSLLFCLLFFLTSPATINAAIEYNPPVKKTKVVQKKHKKRKAASRKKKIKKESRLSPMVVLLLLSVVFITGVVLLIVGLVQMNPVLWITALCLLGAFLLTLFLFLFKKKIRR